MFDLMLRLIILYEGIVCIFWLIIIYMLILIEYDYLFICRRIL